MPKSREPYYQVSGKAVEYVLPFSSRLEGDNEGIVVMRLNMNALEEDLKVSEENKKQNGTTIIYDKDGQNYGHIGMKTKNLKKYIRCQHRILIIGRERMEV